jgi:hypothetical protein
MSNVPSDDVNGDGVSCINIGRYARTPLGRLLHYYDSTPKRLPDGKHFFMFAGYYYYLITTGESSGRFLRMKTTDELEFKRKVDWTNVPGLETHLETALSYNINRSPLALSLVRKHHLPVVWVEPDRELRNAEKRWLRVVQNTLRRLRAEHV